MSIISIRQQEIINNDNPTNQEVSLGDKLQAMATYGMACVRVVVNDTAAAGFDFTMPVAMNIADVVVQAQAAATTGTLQLRRTTTAITDAIVAAVNHTLGRAATIDDEQATTTAGETLNFISTGSDSTEAGKVKAIVYIYGSPV